MKGIKNECYLMERCDGNGGGGMVIREVFGVSLGLRKCDSHQGGVKGIKHECQLMERCDGLDLFSCRILLLLQLYVISLVTKNTLIIDKSFQSCLTPTGLITPV